MMCSLYVSWLLTQVCYAHPYHRILCSMIAYSQPAYKPRHRRVCILAGDCRGAIHCALFPCEETALHPVGRGRNELHPYRCPSHFTSKDGEPSVRDARAIFASSK